MAKQSLNNIRLGIFVIAGLLMLVFILYMIGKNQSLFTSNFRLKVRFKNIEGLMPGNNVRYSGIQTGTVKSLEILNDTTIEVTMLINEDIRGNIRKNSIVYIGSEGLMGNKVINIIPNPTIAQVVEENDILTARPQTDLNNALGTLYQTNDNVAVISDELLQTVQRINNSPVLRRLLSDTVLMTELYTTLSNINSSSRHLNRSAILIDSVITKVHRGEGLAGLLLSDVEAERKGLTIINNIEYASAHVNILAERIDSIARSLQLTITDKAGLIQVLLKDTTIQGQLSRSMSNIENGTAAFSEDMEALKHNFLLRGYFRKKAKREKE